MSRWRSDKNVGGVEKVGRKVRLDGGRLGRRGKRTLASCGNRECISANSADGLRSPRGAISKILKHRCKREAVMRASSASLMRRYGSGVVAVTTRVRSRTAARTFEGRARMT